MVNGVGREGSGTVGGGSAALTRHRQAVPVPSERSHEERKGISDICDMLAARTNGHFRDFGRNIARRCATRRKMTGCKALTTGWFLLASSPVI